MATFMIPPSSLAKLSPSIPGTDCLASWKSTPFMSRTDPLYYALRAYVLGFVNRIARTAHPPPPPSCIEWLESALTSYPKPTLNQLKIEWNMLPTLHEGSGGCYEVSPLMTPKTVTPWTRTLLHHGEWLEILEEL